MITRQKLVTFGIPTLATGTIVLAALLSPWAGGSSEPAMPRPHVVDPGSQGTQIDVVFAVDTTGSMGGLIDGAKRTVWSIANHIRKSDPNATLRIGLVAYRDVGDDYITKDFALTTDLDAVFAELSSFQADGGGDVPENVDAALDVTLHKMKWRTGAKKLVFLVGDAPPASRGDVPTFDVLARKAGEKQIIINTIRAGHDQETALAFKQIASLGGGEFSSIQQDGGVQQIATPYDQKMAELSAKIDSTSIIAGDEGVRRRHAAKMGSVAASPAAAQADRAAYYGKADKRADDDLVGGYATGTMSVDSVNDGQLPTDMRGMAKPALKAELDRRVAARKEAQEEIGKLAKQRDEYLKAQGPAGGEGGFDVTVKATVEKQLK
ncbi:MAG: VWA domain-containing protein [Deltaproteobacteria bacterium]|nr:VWA domain-containing protein [Deltaproteobacteria bacterium]